MNIPEFQYEDVVSLDETLAPIILAGLKKFKEELVESDVRGYPHRMFSLVGIDEGSDVTDEQDQASFEMWLDVLDRMIYAFDPGNEPNMDDYNFEFEWIEYPKEGCEDGLSRIDIDVTNQEEYDRFRQDEREWYDKCKEGRMLLAEYFTDLWL
jgi:hypothetical protein